jgi:nucleoside triphosphatase
MLENVGFMPPLLGLGAAHPPIAAVGAWIQHPFEKRYLLCRSRKWSEKWGMAGGKIQNGETALEAVRREIAEETGLSLKTVEFVCCTESINDPDYFPPRHFIISNYLAIANSPHVLLSPEAQHFAWASLDECRNMTLNTPTATLLAHLTQAGILHD